MPPRTYHSTTITSHLLLECGVGAAHLFALGIRLILILKEWNLIRIEFRTKDFVLYGRSTGISACSTPLYTLCVNGPLVIIRSPTCRVIIFDI